MTNTAEVASDPIVIVGGGSHDIKRPSEGVSDSPLSSLNIFFLLSTVLGGICEYIGSVPLAAGCMIAYLSYGLVSRNSVRNIERFGDSSYYQGFILTLFALGVALTSKGAALKSDEIIQQFGLAIWTTFIGMTGRILIIQFLTTVHDQEDEAREAISKYVEELTREIDAAVRQIRTFRDKVVQSGTDVAREIAEEAQRKNTKVNEAIDESTKALVASVNGATTKLEGAVTGLTVRISNLNVPAHSISSAINKITDALSVDLENDHVRNQVNEFKEILVQTNKTVNQAAKLAASNLSKATAALAAVAEATDGVEKLTQSSGAAAQKLNTLTDAFDKKTVSYVKEFEDMAAKTVAAATAAQDGANAVTTALAESARTITAAVRNLDTRSGRAQQ